jgi:hypothetical protein
MPPRKRKTDESGTDQRSPLVGAGLGRAAYEAYSASVGGSASGWDELDHDTAAAWCAAGRAARVASFRKD